MMNDRSVFELKSICQSFETKSDTIDVLKGASCTLKRGEIVALVAPSGAGKSTLLHISGLLEKAKSGSIIIDGVDCAQLNDDQRTTIRRAKIGFVYQAHRLLGEFSALENVMIPQMLEDISREDARIRAQELLSLVGLEHRLNHRPNQLSGGEQQRVAIVRALANKPQILLADEPTGNLDPKTSSYVFELFLNVIRETGLTALIATHNLDLAAKMDRKLLLQDGKLV